MNTMNLFEKETGYNPYTGLYKSRYYAKKVALGDDVIVKVCGGYKIMNTLDYIIWKHNLKT